MEKVIILVMIFAFTLLGQTGIEPSGGDGSYGNPYHISTWQNLYWLSQNDVYYKYCIQTNDINFGDADPEIQTWDSLRGFDPIKLHSYHGKGYSIDSLYIYRPTENYVGFLQSTPNFSNIDSLILTNVNITGLDYVGGLSGSIFGIVNDCHVSGNVAGERVVGGLVGVNNHDNSDAYAEIRNSVSTCNVTGVDYIGGLAGISSAAIYDSHSTNAIIQGDQYVGGLVGRGSWDMIDMAPYEILRCFAANEVRGSTNVGGFVGANSGIIQNCFSKGDVIVEEGTDISCGGFCGQADAYYSGQGIINCYSTGSVIYNSSNPTDKGFLGEENGVAPVFQSNFFDNEKSNQLTDLNNAATGISTGEMQTEKTFTDGGWDFVGETTNGIEDIWYINGVTNGGYPFFYWMSTGIVDNEQLTIDNYALHQNYPNPFNPETVISYSLQNNAQVNLKVFNIAGKEVCNLVNQKQNKGLYEVSFDGNNLTSGMYFYRLSIDGNVVVSKKMMLLK